jgi:hypothetical protein
MMDSPPPDDAVCDDCDKPLGPDYDERLIAMYSGTIVTELICAECKWKDEQ